MVLEDKVILVTGSSKGIGKAVAMRFAENGAKVVINSRSSISEGLRVVEEIKEFGGDAIYLQADVEIPMRVKTLFSEVYRIHGRLDVLVNNAGSSISKQFLDTDQEYWLSVLNNNFISAVLCSIEAAKIMKAQGWGKIINTSSIRGLEHSGRPGLMAYSAAKAAMNSFTKNLAKELAPNITVNAIAPGIVNTSYMDRVTNELKEQWIHEIPIGRFIQPKEIADAFLFIALSDIMTGEILVVDGGFNLKLA